MGAAVEAAKVKRGADRPGVLCDCGDHVFATLTRGYVTFVSPEDAAVFVCKWSAHIHRNHVAAVRILWPERRPQLLHRLLTDAPEGVSVDHINGDQLDNRRVNLRLCDQAENSWNSRRVRNKASGLPKGVTHKRDRFQAKIHTRGESLYLGVFDTPEQAHDAYARAAFKLHHEFARIE